MECKSRLMPLSFHSSPMMLRKSPRYFREYIKISVSFPGDSCRSCLNIMHSFYAESREVSFELNRVKKAKGKASSEHLKIESFHSGRNSRNVI